MTACEKVQKYPNGFTTESIDVMVCINQQLMVFISESFGDSIQRGRGRVGEVTWTNK